MEPQLPNPNIGTPQTYEAGGNALQPERGDFREVLPGPERVSSPELPRTPERREQRPDPMPSAQQQAVAAPTIATPPQQSTNTVASQAPAVAADDDVIEKEWINMAKKVVALTKGDPFKRGHEVSKLQADYLEKRYGKQVKLPEDA